MSITARRLPSQRPQRYAVALCGQAWDETGGVTSLPEQPLVNSPRLAAAYTYCYNPPLAVRRARQLAATLAWLHEHAQGETITVEGTGAGAGLAAAGAYCLMTIAPQGQRAVRLRLDPAGFRFGKAATIRSAPPPHPGLTPRRPDCRSPQAGCDHRSHSSRCRATKSSSLWCG